MIAYMIPFKVLKKQANLNFVDGEMKVVMTYEEFKAIIKLILRSVEVDERWYTREYEDVAAALANREFGSAKHHFVEDGYFEGRLPRPHMIDEEWYVRNYPDVAEGLRRGNLISASRHYQEFGYNEGRLPSEY